MLFASIAYFFIFVLYSDLELDMKVTAKESDGMVNWTWICLIVRDCEGVIEKLGDKVSANLSDLTLQVKYGSNIIHFKGGFFCRMHVFCT